MLLLGGPNTYLPFLQECWRLRIPQTWDERGYDVPEGRPDRGAHLRPRERAVLRGATARCSTACTRRRTSASLAGSTRCASTSPTGRKARLGETAGPAAVEDDGRARRVPRALQDPEVRAARSSSRGRSCARVIGLDGGSHVDQGRARRLRGRQDPREGLPALEGQPDPGHEGAARAAARLRRADQGAKLEVMGFGATGYAADVLEECVRADVNIVETVAHMMSAVHFFGDVDVICDIGGQDIKVLFMKNGDIANFRLSNQLLRRQRHAAAGDGRLRSACPSRSSPTSRSRRELAPKFSYGCAVFLDTDRVNFQKEGFSKEEMLAGLAQVLPKNVWQYVVQIPRLASLGRKFVLQGGTQYNLAAVKAQVDYIKERVPDAEVFVHPHTGEAGAIGAAMETLRVVKRKRRHARSSASMRRSTSSTRRRTTKRRSATSARTSASARSSTRRRPDGSTSRYIAGFSCEKGTVESKDAMLALVAERKKIAKAVPQHRRLRGEARLHALLRPGAACPTTARPSTTSRSRRASSALRRVAVTRPFKRSQQGGVGSARARCASASRACSTSTRRARSSATYFEALGIPKQNVVFSDETTEEMWVEGGKYGIDRPVLPVARSRRRTSTTCSSTSTPRRSRSSTSSSPSSRTCRTSSSTRWTTRAARSSPARRTS